MEFNSRGQLYVVMEGDLKPKSKINILFKFADNANLLVPQFTDVTILEQFGHMGVRK